MLELTGTIAGLSRDFMSKSPVIDFVLNQEPRGIENYMGKEVTIKIGVQSKPRSLDANAYFHVLCDKLRQKVGVSMAHMKNDLITTYGQIEYIEEGSALVYKTNASPEYTNELEGAHLKFIKKSEDGAYWYKVYRGSHTYDSKEMHQLILGTIQEAKEHGIETATPTELARIEAAWNQQRK